MTSETFDEYSVRVKPTWPTAHEDGYVMAGPFTKEEAVRVAERNPDTCTVVVRQKTVEVTEWEEA